jgi:PAS domain S-box-containing protein
MGKRSGSSADIPAKLLRHSFEEAPCGVAIIDCQKKGDPIVFVDADFEGVTGYSAGEALGRNCISLMKNRRDPEPLRELHRSVRSRRPGTVVFRSDGKDGSASSLQVSTSPLRNNSGDVTYLVWLLRDSTSKVVNAERLRALVTEKEQRFAAYAENATEAIWRIDFDPPIPLDAPEAEQVQAIFDCGVYTEANDATARIYGLSEGREVLGRPLRDFMVQSDPNNIKRMKDLVRHKFRLNNFLTHEKTADGSTVTGVNNVTPGIRDGRMGHVWGTGLDVSVLFKAQEELKRSKKLLASQKKALEDKNIALKELIAHIELDKRDLKERILANVEQVIMPAVEKMLAENNRGGHVELLHKSLEDLTSSFGRRISSFKEKLTPREIEVCTMVRNGLSNKDISNMLSISLQTVQKHRRMARKKLGLTNKGINLNSYLNSME